MLTEKIHKSYKIRSDFLKSYYKQLEGLYGKCDYETRNKRLYLEKSIENLLERQFEYLRIYGN